MADLEQLRQEAENLRKKIRVSWREKDSVCVCGLGVCLLCVRGREFSWCLFACGGEREGRFLDLLSVCVYVENL